MTWDEKEILLKMIQTLLNDLQTIQQRGAGYFDCDSFVTRYNKLLEASLDLLPNSRLMATFSPIQPLQSVDPADKMKMMQRVLIEGDQLATLIGTQLRNDQS